ncbi:MAG: FtsX-like permease family protein [Calditrichaeota bacterium]|nr:FtsX-like permease family protein [Calditrichota bacterium]MCB0290047.1 FtsX-like permease family protein [Calditrichota bacterium]
MIRFLLLGILRDRSRSLFPLIVIIVGVALTVILQTWLSGMLDNMIQSSANFMTGHSKITTRAYAAEAQQMPNDLALLGADSLIAAAAGEFPEMIWTPRIRFGGLLDLPDSSGETRAQGPVFGTAVDLFNPASPEPKLLNLAKALVRGRLPQYPGEILISEDFSRKLGIEPGDTATLLSVTMYGSMAWYNFTIAGTIRFGVVAMDRGAMIADIHDIRKALDMEDAAGEILGFFRDFQYNQTRAGEIAADFNRHYSDPDDEFSPLMKTLREQNNLASLIDVLSWALGGIITIFLLVMFIVLWNAGLMGSLRRYGEIGVRLAIGEDRGHLYRSMLYESVILGILGSLLGTALGLAVSYYLQHQGIDIGSLIKNSSMMFSSVLRARITPLSYIIGFLPGVLATVLGTAVSGIGIYKRQTSQLFKELET